MATAFALATELGVPKTVSAAALASAQGAPHRLQRREEPGMTILDDSYNSNPAGFAAALEVLTLIGGAKPSKKARRKILITPGMVELGTLHAPEHARLGTLAAQHADVVLAVAPQRIPTFTAAVKAAGHTELVLLPTLSAAFAWLRTNGQADDIVLLENDLPDRYEAKWKL
jgi:UDP-N-acetylmuramoyl-tripeptide--D-alanyl-D-alanine ligase